MKIGIIGAMQIEVDNLKAHMEDVSEEVVSGVTFTKGTIGGKEVIAAVCGVGKVFAAICAEAMILTYHVDCVINIGVAGTLCDELGVMDVAIASRVVQHDMNTSALGDPVGLLSGLNEVYLSADEKIYSVIEKCVAAKGINHKVGTIATGDLFLSKESTKNHLHEQFVCHCRRDGRRKYRTSMLCQSSAICYFAQYFRWKRRRNGLCYFCRKGSTGRH